ncbi:MAG: hypothetical protein ABFD92_02940 [Planctomycetaceae bacterium]|nr:hypothetical protein [Planctomycetaceae bacterium]
MCASFDSGSESTLGGPGQSLSDSRISSDSPDMDLALGELHDALRQRQVQLICAAYEACRRAARRAGIDDVMEAAQASCDQPVRPLIVSAYSHRHCFMCNRGTRLCERCHGTGLDGGSRCPNCEGLGLLECGFCGATGWADRAPNPPEIFGEVLHRQYRHMKDGLEKADAELKSVLGGGKIAPMPRDARLKIVAAVLRLQARIRDLIHAQAVPQGEITALETVTEKLDQKLDLFRAKP